MKSVFVLAFAGLIILLQTSTLLAADIKERRADAAQYYSGGDFNKAYKIYFSMAKIGDHYSQSKVSQMYASGEGVKVDLTKAYAWSVLVAESGVKGRTEKSEMLLQEIDDKAKAEKTAAKLVKKYGKQTLAKKAASKAKWEQSHAMGGCTGSKLGCK